MKKLFVNSYYSEIDYSDVNNSGVDGVYEIVYNDFNFTDCDIKKAITDEYEHMQDDEDVVHCLGDVLEVLYKKGKIISWDCMKTVKFDCDYGNFDEDQ